MKKYPYHATLMSPFSIIFLSEKCNIKHSTQYFINTVAQKGHTCSHKLGERTGQLWQDNSRRVLTHEKIGHNNTKHFFVPNQEPPSAGVFGTS